MSGDVFFWLLLTMPAALLLLAVVGPPLQYYFTLLSDGINDRLVNHSAFWLWQGLSATARRQQQQARRSFAQWFADRFETGVGAGVSDEELVQAKHLTPKIRQLLEEELPLSIRRCNHVHRRMALLMAATHMREVAAEPECFGLRQWVALMLEKTTELLERYPLPLRLDTEQLLDATVVVRSSLLPTCSHCPYIRKSVAEAGELCPASRLISVEKTSC